MQRRHLTGFLTATNERENVLMLSLERDDFSIGLEDSAEPSKKNATDCAVTHSLIARSRIFTTCAFFILIEQVAGLANRWKLGGKSADCKQADRAADHQSPGRANRIGDDAEQ